MAIIRVAGTRDVRLTFARSDGREVASAPKALKEAAPEAVAAARAMKKDIEGRSQVNARASRASICPAAALDSISGGKDILIIRSLAISPAA
jgi:hypothetical protein